MFDVTIWGALIAGLASFLSPCVLPLVPPYLCYIGGVSLEQMTDGPEPWVRRSVIVSSIAFMFGLVTTFVGIGLAAALLWDFVGENKTLLTRIAGVIIILMGLHFLHIIKIPLFYREARVEVANRPAGLLGAYVMGLAFGFGWTACTGPVLAMITMMAMQQQDMWLAGRLLFAYGLGMGLPFVGAALLMGPFMRWMARFRRHMGKVEKAIGVALVVVGIMFVIGKTEVLALWMLRAMPWLGKFG